METYTIPLQGIEFKGNSVNEQLLAAVFDLELPVPDTSIREARHMIKDLEEGAEIAKLAIAATGKEWVPARCGYNNIPVAYNKDTGSVATLLVLADKDETERFLIIREPWGPVHLPVWQEIE